MRVLQILFAFGILACSAGSRASAAVISVEEFNAQSKNWASYAEGQLPFTIEGRYSSVSRSSLRLRNCELVFRPERGKELTRPSGESGRVEIGGKLVLDGGKPVFVVERLRDLPSDLDDVRKRSNALRRDKPEDWHDLGQWTRSRAAFYKDAELEKEADGFFLKGVEAERRLISAEQPERYFTLAAKVVELKLPERLRQELVHQGHREIWDAARKAKRPNLRDVAERMARDLPGAEVPLQPPLPKLEKRYEEKPLTVYEESTTDDRRKIHRILYSAVVMANVLSDSKADGSDGIAVADEIDRLVPERHPLAETLREKELSFRMGKVDTATRGEVLALSQIYRDRNQGDLARKAVQTWLARREDLARKDGPDALKLLAEEHLTLLEDDKKAVALLLEASKLSPDSEEIGQRLEKLGYRRKDGKWMTTAEFDAIPVDPIRKAMSMGDVVVGMTASQVRKSLGAPNSTTKASTADETAEIWTYGARNTSRLSIHFLRRHRATAEAKVIAIQKAQ